MKRIKKVVKFSIKQILLAAVLSVLLFSCYDPLDNENTDTTTNDSIPAQIISIDPVQGYVGDTVTITGKDFGLITKNDEYILFDTVKFQPMIVAQSSFTLLVIEWKDDKIVAKIPENVRFGNIDISIFINDTMSNAVQFKVLQPELPAVETVEVPAGSFKMGDLNGTGFENELPVYNVTLTRNLIVGKYEITQAQWRALINNNPSTYAADSLPVNGISWWDAVNFCNLLSDKEGLEQCYSGSGDELECNFDANGYRLPTEAEWEYLCRAGTETDYYNGNSADGLNDIAWWYGNIDFGEESTSHPGGEKSPNGFGIYDMTGNVGEFVWDWWSFSYDDTDVTDPLGPDSGPGKIVRGGSWDSKAVSLRVSFRSLYETPYWKVRYAGLRVVRTKN